MIPESNSDPVPPRWPQPLDTLVVASDGRVIVSIDGALLLPIGSRIALGGDGPDHSVVGVRLTGTAGGPPQLILEVDGGASALELALDEAEAEAAVVEAAELITSTPAELITSQPAETSLDAPPAAEPAH